jgi:GNAT superfamily N-acetyltransferase
MLNFGRLSELRIPNGILLQAREHFEVMPPSEHGPRLSFQVYCNGMPIGHARLEKVERTAYSHNRHNSHNSHNRILNLFDARHCPTYALKIIQISQNYRNRGIGTVLLKEILHYCKNHNVHRVTGEIKGELAALRAWYRKNGFAIVNDTWIEFQLS